MFFGIGSKKNLIENFAKESLNEYHYYVINGYFPALNLKTVFLFFFIFYLFILFSCLLIYFNYLF